MTEEFDGVTARITGGTTGAGLAASRTLATEPAEVRARAGGVAPGPISGTLGPPAGRLPRCAAHLPGQVPGTRPGVAGGPPRVEPSPTGPHGGPATGAESPADGGRADL